MLSTNGDCAEVVRLEKPVVEAGVLKSDKPGDYGKEHHGKLTP